MRIFMPLSILKVMSARFFSSQQRYLFFVLVFALLLLIGVVLMFGWQSDVDTGGYLSFIKCFSGDEIRGLIPWRALRAGGILLALPFTVIFSSFGALTAENILFYFAAMYLMFRLGEEILRGKKAAFLTVIFFSAAYPLLRFGLCALTDMPAWFFYLLSLWLAIRFLKKPSRFSAGLTGLTAGLGVLIKESGGMGILFFLALLFISGRFSRRQIFSYLASSLLFFLLPIFVNQLIVFHYFRYTYLDWYLFNTRRYLGQSYTLFNLSKNFFILFGLGWFFAGAGLRKFWRERRIVGDEGKILLALFIPSLSFFLWGDLTARLMYISGPLLALLAAKGFGVLKNKKLAVGLMLIVIVFNLFLVKLSYLV